MRQLFVAKTYKMVYNKIKIIFSEGVMVEKNKKYTVEITDISSDGNGVCSVDGFTVFVPVTAVGDKAEIVIVKVLSHYAIGRMLKLIEPSLERTEPRCAVFRRCGGCQLQHVDYGAQLRLKKSFIEQAFRRIGGFKDFICDDIIGMEEPYRYRNKCIFPLGIDKKGNIVSGFYARRSHDIIEVDDCIAGAEINGAIKNALIEYMKENGISVYNETAHRGLVRRIFIRIAQSSGEIMVVVSINGDGLPRRERLVKRLRKISDKIVSVYVNINKKRTNNVLGEENRLIFGKKTISDTLCGISFNISPHSFYQVNPKMTERLYGKALEYASIEKNDMVLDVYCGIGTISLAAARLAGKVTGVEIVEQAVMDARENAKANGIENAEFYAKSAEEAVPYLIEKGMRPDVVILDPPRKGSDEATLRAIVSAEPKRIVYVSCGVSTLARDASYLAQFGYEPTKCTGVDMFPHTSHVETVVLMSRVDN